MTRILWLGLAQTLEVTPTFNAGARLACGERTVFIDTFFRGPNEHYQVPTAGQLSALQRTPGDHLILVTHLHRDHADHGVLREHLRANPRAWLAATAQIAGPLAAEFPERVKVLPRGGRHHWKGVEVELYDVPHGGDWRELENSAHRVGLCGQWVFHPGDADAVAVNFEKAGFRGQRVDVALLPFWYLLGPASAPFVRSLGVRREIWAIHGDVTDSAWREKVRAAWPAARVPEIAR